MIVRVTEAKLAATLREAEDRDVVVLRHGHLAGVVVCPERYGALLEGLDGAKAWPRPTTRGHSGRGTGRTQRVGLQACSSTYRFLTA